MPGYGNYDKYPAIALPKLADQAWEGIEDIVAELKGRVDNEDYIMVFDCYPGVNDDEMLKLIERLKPDQLILSESVFKTTGQIEEQLKYQLTDDRVFGHMYSGEIRDFMDEEALDGAVSQVESARGFTVVYGFGASIISRGNLLVYLDLARWEIQLRYRNGMGNYKADNGSEDILKKYKRGFFVEWRIADKHKTPLFNTLDYVLDTNRAREPKLITGNAFRESLKEVGKRPFRTVPYFDPGVWGGQWMKEVCGLDSEKPNFAWSFDGVPEENSLLFDYDGIMVELPAMDAVLYQPLALLGEAVFARFGAEFPIRFDFLDTMEGQNLSLQVHPLREYIKKQFGMDYTQDESYYILDAEEDACVYLGMKDGVDPGHMIEDLKRAQEGVEPFPADAYINSFPARKHDHFLIPAGTCHCSGKNAMVLEISATPYIFTFKLWDWGRLGLDGRPRPIHIEHGEKVIRWERTTDWVREHLVNPVRVLHQGPDYIEEHTGLHELEFIETRRYWFDEELTLDTEGTVSMLNLVEGKEAVIESPEGCFAPFTVHYAETFILPAALGTCRVRVEKGQKTALIRAYVR